MNIKPNFACGTPGLPMTGTQIAKANCVLLEVKDERKEQHAKWGEQSHTPADWYVVLGEEFGEVGRAIYEGDVLGYREELIQTAAVCTAMVEALDRQINEHYGEPEALSNLELETASFELQRLRGKCQNESSK